MMSAAIVCKQFKLFKNNSDYICDQQLLIIITELLKDFQIFEIAFGKGFNVIITNRCNSLKTLKNQEFLWNNRTASPCKDLLAINSNNMKEAYAVKIN